MKRGVLACVVLGLIGTLLHAAAPPEAAEPARDQRWLKQLVGEWEWVGKMTPDEGVPAMEYRGTDKARALGEHWVIIEGQAVVEGTQFHSVLTLGYDSTKQKFVGTWIDTTSGYLWIYEGSLNESAKVLTLTSEGPRPDAPDKRGKFREEIEFKNADTRIHSGSILGDDGKWKKFMTVESTRKK